MVTIQTMEFSVWMNAKYIEWCGKERHTITEFAEYLGVKQPVLSKWMGKKKKLPDLDSVKLIAKRFPDVYQALDFPYAGSAGISFDLDENSPFLKRIAAAVDKLEAELSQRGISMDTPEGKQIATDILSEFMFEHTATENDDN